MSDQYASRYGPWALVTGASSGLGAEFAKQLAARGLNLVLVARRKDRLEENAAKLREANKVDVRVVAADLGGNDFVAAIEEATRDIEVGLLLNNAGFGTTGPFLAMDVDRQNAMVELNCRAPIALTHLLGQKMKERERGAIVFLASVMAFGGAAGWANYNATKAWNLLFAEGVGAELGPHGVDVQALCPGGTRTEFQATAGADADLGALDRLLFMDAPDVVRKSLNNLTSRVVVPGLINKLSVWSAWLMPRFLTTFVFGFIVKKLSPGH